MLLIQPPVEDYYTTSIRTYPLQLLYLATKVKDICDVSVIDFRTKKKPRILTDNPFPELDVYYNAHTYTSLSLFSRYYRFGAGKQEIEQTISGEKPDVVAISALFSPYSSEALEIARIAKSISSSIITVIGGTHATVFPEHTLKGDHVDYAIRGEGETPFFQLISSLRADRREAPTKIPGLSFRRKDGTTHLSQVHFEEDIDVMPDRAFLRTEDYQIHKKPYTFFLTSRGCPFRCTFCGRPPVPYRKRTLRSIERELEECLTLNIRAIDFEDDMLTFDVSLFNRVLDLLEGKNLTVSAMNGIYAETLTEDILNRMLSAGFGRLNFSLVDINPSVVMGQKRHLPARFLQLLPYIESSPFLTEAHFIIGLPGQEPKNVMETLIFLMGKRLLPGPSMFYLAPGSPFFDKAGANDQGPDMRSLRSSYMMEVNPLFPRDAIYTFMKLTRFINFVKHCLDREPSLRKLRDLPDFVTEKKAGVDKEILRSLLFKKRLLRYDVREGILVDEPQDGELLDLFFRMAQGYRIKGFKTGNSLLVDT